MFLRILSVLILGLAGVVPLSIAQSYPARPVKLVVSMAAGGSNDLLARVFTQKLSEQAKQPFIVENRPGGNGIPSVEYVVRSAPDGYTLLLGNTATLAIQVSLFSKLPYDAQRDLVPVSVVAFAPTVLVIHASVPARSIEELVAFAKARPGKLNYASPGNGTSFHLSGELFKMQTGTQLVHVPYKGSAPALADVIAGRVEMLFANVPEAMPHIKGGKLRPLASTGAARLPMLPDVPTMAEAGFKNAESGSFFAVVAPKGTPREIIATLHAEIAKAVNQPDVRQKLNELGCEAAAQSPEESEAYIRNEVARWAKVVRESGARVDN